MNLISYYFLYVSRYEVLPQMCQNVSLGLWTECVYLQITEQIQTLQEDKLQSYKMEIAKDAAGAVMLVSEFEVSIHTPAMVL